MDVLLAAAGLEGRVVEADARGGDLDCAGGGVGGDLCFDFVGFFVFEEGGEGGEEFADGGGVEFDGAVVGCDFEVADDVGEG